MKRCPKCRGGNPDAAVQCKNCGTPFAGPVDGTADAASGPIVPEGGPPAERDPDRGGRRSWILWPVVTLVGLALFALFYFVVLRPIPGTAPTQPTPAPLPQVAPSEPAEPRELPADEAAAEPIAPVLPVE